MPAKGFNSFHWPVYLPAHFLILIKIVMKKSNQALRYFWGAFLCVVFCQNAFAQTDESDFLIQMTDSKGGTTVYYEDAYCGFIGAIGWGGAVSKEVVGEAIWAKDLVGNDSLACDSIKAGSLAGKIAVIRRGGCTFNVKALRAKRAGAIAIIMVMDSRLEETSTFGIKYLIDDCSTGLMGGGDVIAETNIPVIFMPREFGKVLDAGLKFGKVNVGFYFERLYGGTTAQSYATPVSQADTMDFITVLHANRGTTPQTNVQFKVEITAPNGQKQTLERTIPSIGPSVDVEGDSFIVFPSYVPPAIKGKFKAVFTNSVYKEKRDTMTRFFELTDYTFATDNFNISTGGIGVSEEFFDDFSNREIQSAGICWTGDKTNTKATHVTFGLANAKSLFVANNDAANTMNVFLYDAAPAGSFALDAEFGDIEEGLIGFGAYKIKGNEAVDALIDVALLDIETQKIAPIPLSTNYPYYVSVKYTRPEVVAPTVPFFTVSYGVDYIGFNGLPSTPLQLDQIYGGGWGSREVVQRLQLEGYKPTVGVESFNLEKNKLSIGPIPATDVLTLNFNLAKNSKNAYISVVDMKGHTITSHHLANVQNGTHAIDVKNVPSGNYAIIVQTDEGATARKISVCH
jgi:PA domain/Secretion system C-terminal sorting domain